MKDVKKRWGRTDFQLVASVLHELRPDAIDKHPFDCSQAEAGRIAQWQNTVHRFGAACLDKSNLTPNGNKAFNIDKFMAWVTEGV